MQAVGLSGDVLGAFGGEASEPPSLDNLVRRLECEEFDLIAVGRAPVADPAWAAKVSQGRTDDLRGFTADAFAELL